MYRRTGVHGAALGSLIGVGRVIVQIRAVRPRFLPLVVISFPDLAGWARPIIRSLSASGQLQRARVIHPAELAGHADQLGGNRLRLVHGLLVSLNRTLTGPGHDVGRLTGAGTRGQLGTGGQLQGERRADLPIRPLHPVIRQGGAQGLHGRQPGRLRPRRSSASSVT